MARGVPEDPPPVPPPGTAPFVPAPAFPSATATPAWTPPLRGTVPAGQCPKPFWISAEYLLWFVKGSPLSQPLFITSTDGSFPVLGEENTRVLFGGSDLNGSDPYSGLRFRGGYYFDDCGFGVDLGVFFLENKGTTFSVASDANGNPTLGRPIINADTNGEETFLNSFPSRLTGGVSASLQTQLWGAEANLSRRVAFGPIEMLYGGFRYLRLREKLSIAERVTTVPGNVGGLDFGGQPTAEGDVVTSNDTFKTRNDFYGGQVGFRGVMRWGAFDVALRSMLALGVMVENLSVSGQSTLTPIAGQPRTLPGGVLALPTNIRNQTRSEFAVVPEVDLSVGYNITDWARVFVGYNFLYASSVIRPGDQIDRRINPSQVPSDFTYDPGAPAANPQPLFKTTDFWAQGINFGVTLSF